jgi:hypothetical protein
VSLRPQARGPTRSAAARLALPLFCALACAAAPAGAAAQSFLRGRVTKDGEGVPGAPVELHRVTADSGGVVARATSGPGGAFALPLPPVDTAAGFTLLFATAAAGGVRYFGPALRPGAPPAGYEIAVHDTTSSPAAAESVRVSRRDLLLAPEEGGGWQATEVLRVRNLARRTLLADPRPLVGLALPAGATAFEASPEGGGPSPANPGLAHVGGRVWFTEPLRPGDRELAFRYRLPPSVRRTEVVFAQPADTFFLFIREPGPRVKVTGILSGAPMAAEGARFVRYDAYGVRPGTRIGLDWADGGGGPRAGRWLAAAALAGAAAAVAAWIARRRRAAAG